MSETKILPVLPLRDIVVFPHMVVPLFVGREKSVKALDEIMKGEKQILLATQKNSVDDDPQADAIYPIGVLATVLQLLKLPDGTVKVLVEGRSRARLTRFTDRTDYFEAEAVEIADDPGEPSQSEALLRAVIEQFENYVKLNKKVPPEALSSIPQITDPSKLADSVAAHLSVKIADKQALLETIETPGCPQCGSPIQRIVHGEHETNYCPACQTEGRLLKDRALSRLLGEDWPKTVDAHRMLEAVLAREPNHPGALLLEARWLLSEGRREQALVRARAAALRAPGWPIEYALGIMRFRLPRLFAPLHPVPAVLGHSGSTGCWLWKILKTSVSVDSAGPPREAMTKTTPSTTTMAIPRSANPMAVSFMAQAP